MFTITKESSIIIYGAGDKAKTLSSKLIESGYKVCFFIDKNVKGSIYNIPVFDVEEAVHSINKASEYILIITLNDGSKHFEIAKQFNSYGITNIVYLPFENTCSLVSKRELRFTYKEVVINYNFNVTCPNYNESHLTVSKYNVINDNYKDSIVLWYPLDKLYCVKDNLLAKDFIEYVELFSVLKEIAEKRTTLSEAMQKYYSKIYPYMIFNGRTTKSECERLLKNRLDLYNFYLNAEKYDPSFFTDSPVEVEIRGKNVYVIDGYHRLHFLMMQGYKYIPIIVNKQELGSIV